MTTEETAARTVGIVIRTLERERVDPRCLETLAAQSGDFDLDVLVVDSGSTDATLEIAQAHGARITTLAPGDFDYSKALNLGIEQVRGEIVVSLSAHAIPVDDDWLERTTAHFSDPRVAGVFTRQVPWPGAPWQEVHRLRHQFGPTPRIYANGDAADVVFSNAASAIRRSVVERPALHAASGRGHRLGAASRVGRLADRLRARRLGLPFPSRRPSGTGPEADRHQSRSRQSSGAADSSADTAGGSRSAGSRVREDPRARRAAGSQGRLPRGSPPHRVVLPRRLHSWRHNRRASA